MCAHPNDYSSQNQPPVSRFGAFQRPKKGVYCLKVCNASEAVLGPDPAGCFWIYPHSRTGTTSAVCRAPFGSRQAQRGRQLDPHPAQQQGQQRYPCRHIPRRSRQDAVDRPWCQPVQQGFRCKDGRHHRHRVPQHQPRKPITQSHLNPPPRLHRATVAAMYQRTTGHSGPHAGAGIRYQ